MAGAQGSRVLAGWPDACSHPTCEAAACAAADSWGWLINPWGLQVWMLDLATGSRRLVLQRQVSEQPVDLSFAPDGRWLIAHEYPDAASLGADGMPLVAINVHSRRLVQIGRSLAYPNAKTWCGGEARGTPTDFGGRISTMKEGIAAAAPPNWHPTTNPPAGGKTSWTPSRVRSPASFWSQAARHPMTVPLGKSTAALPAPPRHPRPAATDRQRDADEG